MPSYIHLNPDSLTVPAKHRSPKHRLQAIEWSQKLLSEKNDWVILDTESTGIGENSTVIHLAILSRSGEPILDTLVKPRPRAKIDESVLVGIGAKDRKSLNNAPSIEDLIDEIRNSVKNRDVITYDAEFRQRILTQTGLTLNGRMNCVMIPYAAFIGEWFESKSDYKFQKLPKPGKRWNAMDDCKTTLDLLYFMADYQKPTVKPWWQFW